MLSDVLARANERGYSHEEIRGCMIQDLGEGLWEIDTEHPAYPRARDSTAGPSLASKVVNFATASAKHLAAGAPMASEEEIKRRHAICVACEFFDGSACKKCGCPVIREKHYLSKLSWADQSCPVGKWGPASSG